MDKIMTFACRYFYLTLWWLLLSSTYKNPWMCVCLLMIDSSSEDHDFLSKFDGNAGFIYWFFFYVVMKQSWSRVNFDFSTLQALRSWLLKMSIYETKCWIDKSEIVVNRENTSGRKNVLKSKTEVTKQVSGSGVSAVDVLDFAASEVFRSKRGNYHGFRKRV